MAQHSAQRDTAAERLVQPPDAPHVGEEGARQAPLGVHLNDHPPRRHLVAQLVHDQLPAWFPCRVGVNVLKVAELCLPLQHGAHGGARRLDNVEEEEDRALRQLGRSLTSVPGRR